jgi:carbamoyltransferase
MTHAYWGEDFSEQAIDAALREGSVPNVAYDDIQKLIEKVVESLVAGKVVGWFQGRSEWGPRGLGNRSILADPRRPEMKDTVNLKIKFREPYRPFAPSVLTERAEQLFEVADPQRHYPARFMLYVVKVREQAQARIPAITHVDGTGRLQTVDRVNAERYYDLIRCFGEASGVPVLLNTSFNLKGEPMVNTPRDALRTFRISGMDSLVLGNRLIEKKEGREQVC